MRGFETELLVLNRVMNGEDGRTLIGSLLSLAGLYLEGSEVVVFGSLQVCLHTASSGKPRCSFKVVQRVTPRLALLLLGGIWPPLVLHLASAL